MKKETSKVFSVLLISVLFISIFTVIVAAAPATASGSFAEGFEAFIQGIKDTGDPLFRALLGKSATGQQWVIQILAFLLVVFVVYGILDNTNLIKNKWLNMGIGVVIAILGIRFLPTSMLEQLAVPSSAFVAVLVMGLPMILLFVLMKDLPSLVRRVIWTAYGVMILILWIINFNNPAISGSAKAVYPVIVIACIIVFAFDGTLQRFWHKAQTQRTLESTSSVARNRVIAEIRDLQNALAAATTNKERTKISRQIEGKRKNLASMHT